jgi:DNA-binding transcriptional LysR family regulator
MARVLDLALLNSFVAVADEGGATAAANRLGLSQSAVSLQMTRLEEQVGASLFRKQGRGNVLTNAGERLLSHARTMLRLSETALAELSAAPLQGSVRLGTPEDFASVHLPGVLARFGEQYPRVRLEVDCDFTLHLLDRFAAGAYDLVLIKREPGAGVLQDEGTRVWREALVWAGAAKLSLDASEPVPLVVTPRPCVYRQRAMTSLDQIGRPWRVVYTSPSLAGVQAAVRAGLGLAVLPREMTPDDAAIRGPADGLPELADTEIALLNAPSRISPAAQALADFIVTALE